MLIYIVILAMLFMASLSRTRTQFRVGNIRYSSSVVYALMCFILLFLFAGLREGVGADFYTYRDSMVAYNEGRFPVWLNYEWGFMKLLWLLSGFTRDGQLLIIVCSFITVGLFVYVFLKCSEDVRLSILLFYALYFYFLSFNAIRSLLSVSIVMLAIKPLRERKLIKYMIIVAVASLFHTSAVVMIPFYFIIGKSVKKFLYIIGVPATMGVLILYRPIYEFLMVMFPKYAIYADANGGGTKWNLLFLLFNLLLLKMTSAKNNEEETLNLYEVACLAAIFFSVMAMLNELMVRFALFFYAYSLISVPFCLNRLKTSGQSKTILRCVAYILPMIIFLRYLIAGIAGIGPYQIYHR